MPHLCGDNETNEANADAAAGVVAKENVDDSMEIDGEDGEQGKNGGVADTRKSPKPKVQPTLAGKRVAVAGGKNVPKKKSDYKSTKHFTIEQKLDIIQKCKRRDQTVAQIIRFHGTSKAAIYRWRRDEEKLREQLENEKRGKLKRAYENDPLKRIKKAVLVFYELNSNMPKDCKIPVTGKYNVLIV